MFLNFLDSIESNVHSINIYNKLIFLFNLVSDGLVL